MSNRNPVVFRDQFAAIIKHIVRSTRLEMHQSPCESCLTCQSFNEEHEVCMISVDKATNTYMRPPARVIAFGCPNYDDIPF